MRKLVIAALLIVVVVVAGRFMFARDERSIAVTPALVESNERQQPSAATAPAAAAPSAASEDLHPLPPGLTQEEARERRRLLELEAAATARFNDTVMTDGLEADRVLPAVRAVFESMKLEPAFDPDRGRKGYVNGMRIAELSGRNPLARAGFRVGDRLTRLDGQPLEDPAQIAYIIIGLRGRFEVCAVRDGADWCRTVEAAGG